jgi:hypothetical protein
MTANLKRRQLLQIGCFAAAALRLTACGGAAFAASYRPKIETPSAAYGEGASGIRVLVTSTTKLDRLQKPPCGSERSLRSLVTPASEGLFAGAIVPEKLAFLDRLMVMMMKVPAGDYRDWNQIEAWAAGVG